MLNAPRRVAVWAAVILGGLVLTAPEAQAHGKVPNLVAYCNAKHGGPTVFDLRKWQVEYDVKNRRWLCLKPQTWGVNTSIPAQQVPIEINDVCWTQFRTSQSHFHSGSNVKSPASVHCGETEGIVGAAPAAPRQADSVLQLCNASTSSELYAALAYWDLDPSRGPGWTSEGWYKLGRNQCRDLGLGRPYQGAVYVYAETTAKTWDAPEAGASFCIQGSQSFEIPRSDEAPCEGDRRRVKMIKFTIAPGANRWNFR